MVKTVKSRIEGGVIVPPTGAELIVTDHCNISCENCNHGSPVIRKWLADPKTVQRDLTVLGKVYRPGFLEMIGGEPLLHPEILGVIEAARASGITDYLMMVTNGMFLDKMPDEIWAALDEVEVSRYAATSLSDTMLARARRKARRFGARLTVNDFADFRENFTSIPTEDDGLVRKIFDACKIANLWGCHGVYKSRVYKCPQSMYAPQLANGDFEDGLPIEESPGFRDSLLEFLNASEPLNSCRYCIGTVGRKRPHRVIARKEWLPAIARPAEEMVDYDLLEQSLVDMVPLDDCKVPAPKKRLLPASFSRSS